MPFKFNPFTQNFDAVYDDTALDARLDILESGTFSSSSVYRKKTATESVTSSTTLQDDDHLSFPIAANEIWVIDYELYVTGGTTGDIKICVNVPSGATGEFSATGFGSSATSSQDTITTSGSSDLTDTGILVRGVVNGFDNRINARLHIINGATAGTVKLRWAQNTSNGTATNVLINSFLRGDRVYPATPAGQNYGSWALVKRITVGVDVAAPATSVDFTGLDLDSDSQYLLVYKLKNNTGSASNLSLFFNGDTTATNYNRQSLNGIASTPTSGRVNDALIGSLPASQECCGEVKIYSPATGCQVRSIAQTLADTTTNMFLQFMGHKWDTIANVNAIRVTGSVASSLASGSKFELYKFSPVVSQPLESIIIAIPDNGTAITTGANKIIMRMPYAFRLQGTDGVRGSLSNAQASGSLLTVDVNKSGSSILSTKLTFDNTEKTTVTAATPPVISSIDLADDEEISVDVDTVGTAGALGLKIMLRGRRTI